MKNSNKNKQISTSSNSKNRAQGYNLVKGSKVQISPVCDLYQAYNRKTKQVWHAKIFDNRKLNQYGLSECLEYNSQILRNCKDKQNIIFVQQIFLIGDSTFIIQEKYDQSLVDRVNDSYPVFTGYIQDMLNDVISGLIQVYNEQYATRNLRPQHVVCVDGVWKIQSFVLNSDLFGIQSEFCWDDRFASPQDRSKDQQLSQRQIDEQLVWSIGILGLYMILGPNFQYQKITKDNFIPWNKVKQNSGQCLYRFLVKALKVDFKERMRFRQLFQNQLFSHLSPNQSPFQSYSKFYGQQSKQLKKQNKSSSSLNQEDSQKMKLLRNEVERFMFFGEIQKYTQQLPYKSSFDVNLIRYLSFKICYQNLHKIRNQLAIWKRENPSLRDYSFLRQFQQDLGIFINKVKQSKINYSKNVKGQQYTKSQITEIKNSLNHQIIDEKILYSQVVTLYLKLAGSIYTIVSRDCENKPNQSKQRTVCFYSLGAYLIYFYDIDKFNEAKAFQTNGILKLSKLINQAPVRFLINLTQTLIKQNFATAQHI